VASAAFGSDWTAGRRPLAADTELVAFFAVEGHQTGKTVSVSASGVNIEHLLPHGVGAGLAEVDFDLDGGLQSLYIVEDQWECDQAPSDGDGAKNDGTEGHRPETLLLLHLDVSRRLCRITERD
jgi:hypothetical protein